MSAASGKHRETVKVPLCVFVAAYVLGDVGMSFALCTGERPADLPVGRTLL
jgi:hypothetical protein